MKYDFKTFTEITNRLFQKEFEEQVNNANIFMRDVVLRYANWILKSKARKQFFNIERFLLKRDGAPYDSLYAETLSQDGSLQDIRVAELTTFFVGALDGFTPNKPIPSLDSVYWRNSEGETSFYVYQLHYNAFQFLLENFIREGAESYAQNLPQPEKLSKSIKETIRNSSFVYLTSEEYLNNMYDAISSNNLSHFFSKFLEDNSFQQTKLFLEEFKKTENSTIVGRGLGNYHRGVPNLKIIEEFEDHLDVRYNGKVSKVRFSEPKLLVSSNIMHPIATSLYAFKVFDLRKQKTLEDVTLLKRVNIAYSMNRPISKNEDCLDVLKKKINLIRGEGLELNSITVQGRFSR